MPTPPSDSGAPEGSTHTNPYAGPPGSGQAPAGPDYPPYGPQSAGNPYQSPQAPGAAYGAGPPPPYPGAPGAEVPGRGKAIAALVLGLVSAITWLIPLLGMPTTITGLVLGLQSRNQHPSGMATAGVVLSAIFFGLTLINCVAGAYLGATGQHPLVN